MILLNQILFYKVIWYIKWRTLPMPVCSGLYGPRGSRTTTKPKSGYPGDRLRSSTFHSFETPQEPKMLSALNARGQAIFARYNRFPPRRHVQKLFVFEIEFRFTFLSQKSQKVDLKVPFDFQKLMYFQWSSSSCFWA